MEYLLSKLITHISEQMPELSLVDEDYGQLENLDREDTDMYHLTYPCVLIEPSKVDWSYIEGHSQKGDATLRVRLIIDCYDDTHAQSGTTYKIIEREEMRARLNAILQGYRPSDDGGLMRTQSTFYTFNHGIKVYESFYTCTVTEMVKKQGTVNMSTPPRIALKLEHP